MKKNLNLQSFIPPFIFLFLKYLFLSFKNFPYRKLIKKNKKIMGQYDGESVCIVGNGPSINSCEDYIKSFNNIIVMNNFYKGEIAKYVKPVAYCIGEPTHSRSWSDPIKIQSQYDSGSFWIDVSNAKMHSKESQDMFNYVSGCISPNSNGLIGSMHGSCLGYQTTAVLAIQVAIYLGFKNITLVGFEHSWLATPDQLAHFYSKERDQDDMIHMLSQYKTINHYAQKNNILISNATPNSFLDVFPQTKIINNK
jgi:hypothetical protein